MKSLLRLPLKAIAGIGRSGAYLSDRLSDILYRFGRIASHLYRPFDWVGTKVPFIQRYIITPFLIAVFAIASGVAIHTFFITLSAGVIIAFIAGIAAFIQAIAWMPSYSGLISLTWTSGIVSSLIMIGDLCEYLSITCHSRRCA